MKLKLNLENFQNITLVASEEFDKDWRYRILLDQLKDWIDYTPHARPLAEHIQGLLEKKVEGKGETEGLDGNRVKSIDRHIETTQTDSKPLPIIAEVDPLKETEEVIMDLSEVTIIVQTEKSLLVSKKGYQKCVARSIITSVTFVDDETFDTTDWFTDGDYLAKIVIKEDKRKWFNEKKSWDKLRIMKGGGS